MRHPSAWFVTLGFCAVSALAGCSDDEPAAGNNGGSAGTGGGGGNTNGAAGVGATSGSAGVGGTAGQGGAGGSGTGGSAGSGTGGSAGGGAGGSAGAASCSLVESGPVQITQDGQLVQGLRITSTSGPAIDTRGFDNVIVRNVEIRHAGGEGIRVTGSSDVLLDHVSVEHTGAPASGANSSADLLNISCYQSPRLTVSHARLTRGSSGIYLHECASSKLSFIEGHDFRGPFPRGQLVQWNDSSDGLLEDFSVENPVGSWPEDNVNVYKSLNAMIRRGLVDGNNSPSGVGVIFDGDSSTGRVEDVDAVRMGNGCFSNYAGADGNVFLRTRCRENICTDQGRGTPGSNALMWAGKPGLTQLRVEASSYYAACNPGNIVWPQDSFAVHEVTEEDFTLRAPIRVSLCWE